jgi:predicted AlkP superfamily phosphohydrolase/phosphomutase
MALFKRKNRPRVCVIGLDGVPFSLLLDLAQKSIMPGMNSLIDSGCLHQLKASLPEISAVSWTNFMTGSMAFLASPTSGPTLTRSVFPISWM